MRASRADIAGTRCPELPLTEKGVEWPAARGTRIGTAEMSENHGTILK
jgi:hypothetical protein